MFEKEAEYWIKNNLHSTEEDYIKAYKDCAEFGYNKAKEEINKIGLALQSDMDKTIEQNMILKKELEKANEWHYVKDGDLPSDKHGHVVINQDWDKVTIRNGRFEYLDGYKADVVAWKEIVFPKESE